jgi:hypothetical protein
MAQWNGQYTGNTHATKVLDLEGTLSHAISVFREADSAEESRTKEKAVRKLAEKLLSARLKFLKAKISDAAPVTEKDASHRNSRVDTLRRQEIKVRSDGVNGILAEFGVEDLVE